MTGLVVVIAALAVLQVKHWVFDVLQQPSCIIKNKGTYGKGGGLLHAAGHMLG